MTDPGYRALAGSTIPETTTNSVPTNAFGPEGGDVVAKRVSMVGFIAIALMIFLIWNNPSGSASTVNSFLDAVGNIASQAWDKLGEFVKGLAGG